MTFRQIEKILINDGWYLKNTKGSHCQYIHQTKRGKVTIPRHKGDIDKKTAKTIFKQAGLE